MQAQNDWLIDFQVKHGRKPTDQEIAEAAKTGFMITEGPAASKLPAWMLKLGLGKVTFTWFTLLEILILICIAIFGYVVGYLFL